MKAGILIFATAACWVGFALVAAAQQIGTSVPDRLKVTVDTQRSSAPVSKYEYGQFIEHIGSTMYGSLWAATLDDRKFYFPISSKEESASQSVAPISVNVYQLPIADGGQ